MTAIYGTLLANGSCAHPSGFGDAAALVFAPGWQVLSSDGGCLRHDGDTRAFAVARVVPPLARLVNATAWLPGAFVLKEWRGE